MDLDAKRRRVSKEQGDESCSQTTQELAAARNELAAIKEKLQDCGDWRDKQNKDKFNEELLGVFFSITKANKCAKEHVKYEISQEYEDDDKDSDVEEDEDEEDDSLYTWNNEDSNDGDTYHRVWVERKCIEDVTDSFHP